MTSRPITVLCARLHSSRRAGHQGKLAHLLCELVYGVEQQPPNAVLADPTPFGACGLPPEYVANVVQRVALARYRLATRIGLAPHPYVARMAAANARLGTICAIPQKDTAGFISGWDVSRLPGITRDQAGRMRTDGLRSAGDVVAATVKTLAPYVGSTGAAEELRLAARGLGSRPLVPSARPDVDGLRPANLADPSEHQWQDLIRNWARLVEGLAVLQPGVVAAPRWRPDADTPTLLDSEVGMYALVAQKQTA